MRRVLGAAALGAAALIGCVGDTSTLPEPDSGCCDDAQVLPEISTGTDAGDDACSLCVDASPDVGTIDASDGGVADASDDGLADASDAAPPCTNGAVQCSGNDPQVCSNGLWVANGGTCNYGCLNSDGGVACACAAPSGRLKFDFLGAIDNGAFGTDVQGIVDNGTNYTWLSSKDASWVVHYAQAANICSSISLTDGGPGFHLASLAELETLLAEQTDGTWCSPNDVDAVTFNSGPYGFYYQNVYAWTSDTTGCGAGQHRVLRLDTSVVSCDSDTVGNDVTWCVQ